VHNYSYNLSLRIWHPSINPDDITRELGIQPNRSWKAGRKRTTPKGTPLEGFYQESYWTADPFQFGEHSSTENLAEDFFINLLEVLEPNKAFLKKLRDYAPF